MKLGWKLGVFKDWGRVDGRRNWRVSSRRRRQSQQQSVEVLEARALLATTYQAVAAGSIRDLGRDGTPDSFEPVQNGFIARSATSENRAVAEFSLGSAPVNLAVLDFSLGLWNVAGDQTRQFDVYLYAGDGQLSLGDFNASGSLVGMATLSVPIGNDTYRLDVTSAVQQIVGSGNSHVGLRIVAHDDATTSVLSSPTLTINGVAVARGFRGWETTKNAILADGVETFRLEVDAGGDVSSVELDTAITDYRLFKPGTGRIALRDDGLAGDRVAGDNVFTSGEFRYNTAYAMDDFYNRHPDSVRGIEIINVGTVYFVELDGTQNEFLIAPEVGIVSPDLPSVAGTVLSGNVQVTPHLINVNSASYTTQSSMRGSGGWVHPLTNTIYSVLPDEFDFFNFFSTNHLEVSPRLSQVNFHAGVHGTSKTDWTGSGQGLTDNTASYGSDGRLLGLNLLDTMSRGIWASNVTHELVYQWSAYLDPALGVSSGAHYLHNSSAASLVGGHQWTPNPDGSYTINFDEGRNGATHASPLELYFMGLIDKTQVPDILVYDPVATPKSSSNPIVLASEITRRVSIDDIIALYGERTGPVRTDFRIGFVAESHNRFLSPTELTFYEQLAAHYTRSTPADEVDAISDWGWSSIDRFFGHGSTWTTLLPGKTEVVNHAPVAQPSSFFVESNAQSGAIVGSVSATDEDEGQTLQYAIIEGHVSPHVFKINPATGQISIQYPTRLNDRAQHVLKVRVTDNGTPQQYDTVDVVINVIPNAAPELAPQTFSVNENTINTTVVGTVLATDTNAGQTFSYSLVSSSVPGAFRITQNSGQSHAIIRVNDSTLLNYEVNPTITIDIRVTDNGIPALSSTSTITINLNDLNEWPTLPAQSMSVAENSPNGTVVGTVSASDPDNGQSLSYSISFGNTSGAFAINSATGQITVANAAALNYESLKSVALYINVFDNGSPQRMDSDYVTINFTDVSEPPVINAQSYFIAENSANGVAVGTVVATEPDAGQTLSYSIVSGNTSGAFAINSATGQITVADSSMLNYEATTSFALLVEVSDSGSPSLSAAATVTINLTNVNEQPALTAQSFSINENALNVTTVGTVLATDVDAGQSFSYSLVSSSVPGAFRIVQYSGDRHATILVNDSTLLNYEVNPTVTLDIRVTDNGVPALSSTATIIINLNDLNETPAIPAQSLSVAENSPNGTVVGTVAASDPDNGQTLSYSILFGNTSGAFALDSATGQITVANSAALNYELLQSVALYVLVHDSGTPQKMASNYVTINLSDVSEPPAVDDQSFSVAENSANGVAVGTVAASDLDAGQTLSYSIVSGNTSGAFAINSTTGQITVADSSMLNYEATPTFALQVEVADSGSPSLSSTATITINLTNVNEQPTLAAQSFSINENTVHTTTVGTFLATDVDAGQTFSYSIISSSVPGAFRIVQFNGNNYTTILVNDSASLNYEVNPTITLDIRVTDSGVPALSSTATITINLNDLNETPTIPAQSMSVAENSPNGTVVGTVSAGDPDNGQSLSYSIFSGNTSGAFAINSATGQITVANAAALNYESLQSVTLNINVFDNGTPQRMASNSVTISISDVNDQPTLAAQSFSLSENSANGTVVGTVTASDADAGQTLSYSIVSGNTSGAFAINSATGRITVANSLALDFETTPSFPLLVRATDNGTPQLSATQTITVTLLDVVEAITVGLDVVPSDSTNTFRRTAKFETAILSTSTFDARQVNVSTIRFGKLGTENSVVRDKSGNVVYSLRDVNGDGRLDLVVQIDGTKTGLAVGDTLARFTGSLLNGTPILGSSAVIVKR